MGGKVKTAIKGKNKIIADEGEARGRQRERSERKQSNQTFLRLIEGRNEIESWLSEWKLPSEPARSRPAHLVVNAWRFASQGQRARNSIHFGDVLRGPNATERETSCPTVCLSWTITKTPTGIEPSTTKKISGGSMPRSTLHRRIDLAERSLTKSSIARMGCRSSGHVLFVTPMAFIGNMDGISN